METYTMTNADFVAYYQGNLGRNPIEATTGKSLYDPSVVSDAEGTALRYWVEVENPDPDNTPDEFMVLPLDGEITLAVTVDVIRPVS